MSYVKDGEIWPKRDPFTGREICHACWNQNHKNCGAMHDIFNHIKCDHVKTSKYGDVISKPCEKCKHECDCICRSESAYADEEKVCIRAAKKERKAAQEKALESPDNPLRGINFEWKGSVRP